MGIDSDNEEQQSPGFGRSILPDGGILPSSNKTSALRLTILTIALFVFLLGMEVVDIAIDSRIPGDPDRLMVEGSILIACTLGLTALCVSLFQYRREGAALSHQVAHWQEEAALWRNEAQLALEGFGAAIDRQFSRWGLTQAERDVALLIVKGHAIQEIADIRATSHRTVAQQARVIYRKAGVGGRNELSAFFLEEILMPRPGARPPPGDDAL